MVAAGMTPAQVLVAATRSSAEILKIDELGMVAAGAKYGQHAEHACCAFFLSQTPDSRPRDQVLDSCPQFRKIMTTAMENSQISLSALH